MMLQTLHTEVAGLHSQIKLAATFDEMMAVHARQYVLRVQRAILSSQFSLETLTVCFLLQREV